MGDGCAKSDKIVPRVLFKTGKVNYPSNMEDGTSATAICDAIKKIRKVLKKRPFEDNIFKVAAEMSGLSRESLRRTLSSLVESGAIYMSKTAEDEDS